MAENTSTPSQDNDTAVKYTVVYDTLCGWSYGAADVLDAMVHSGAEVDIVHRYLFQGDRAPLLADGYREHMEDADARIAELSGAEYTDAYAANVRNSPTEQLESGLTADAAALLREIDPSREFELSRRLQKRRFVDGVSAQDRAALVDELVAFGIDRDQAERVGSDDIRKISSSLSKDAAAKMAAAGAQGVPAVIAHSPSGDSVIEVGQFYDNPEAGAEALRQGATK